jgi:hypothetical protein
MRYRILSLPNGDLIANRETWQAVLAELQTDRGAMSLFRAVKAARERVPDAETQRLTLTREDADAVLRLAGVSV